MFQTVGERRVRVRRGVVMGAGRPIKLLRSLGKCHTGYEKLKAMRDGASMALAMMRAADVRL